MQIEISLTNLKTALTLPCVLFLAFALAGCTVIQRSEIIRREKVRDAANRYASGNWMEQRDAVKEIVTYYGPQKNDLIIGTLLVATQNPYPSVRIEALEGLLRCRLASTRDVIRKIALEDQDADVRWNALKVLRVFRNPSDIDIFIKGLQNQDWLIREESIKGILRMDDETVKTKLVPYIIMAFNDPRTSVSLTALQNVETKDDRLYRVIAEKFNACTEWNYSLLQATLTALRGYTLDEKTRAKVITLLVHQNLDLRLLALRVLKSEKNKRVPVK